MDRNREARRASIVGSNGFNRRRHRTSNLRDSPDEDGVPELQESVRLRDRVKKDRDRDRERERDRERGRERDRERDLRERSSRSKRRRAEKLTMNREDIGGDETTEESVNDDEDEEEEDNTSAASSVRQLTPAVGSISNHHHHGHVSNRHHSHITSYSQQHHSNTAGNMTSNNHHLQHRKSFPSSKVFRASPVWKSGDEMISVSVPRKARSACTKRSHDWASSSSNNNSGGGVAGGEQTLRQASSSPVRQGLVLTSALTAASLSPSSTNVSIRKKLKPSVNSTGPTLRPPKVSSKPSSSNPEELEIEIAEVLYGLMTQSQGPSSKKEESREVNRSNGDAKSRHSSPISNSTSTINPSLGPTSSPLSAVAPKRKRPRQIPENPSCSGARSSPMSGKPEPDQTPKSESSSPCLERTSGAAAENGYDMGGNSVNSQGPPAEPREPMAPESTKLNLGLKPGDEESKESRDFAPKEDVSSPKEKESAAVGTEDSSNKDSPSTATTAVADTMIKANSVVSDVENHKEEKFEIDLMAPPPQVKSSPEREIMTDSSAAAEDQKPVLSAVDSDLRQLALKDKEDDEAKGGKEQSANATAEEKKCKGTGDEAESHKAAGNKAMDINLQVDFVKTERDGTAGVDATGNKLPVQPQQHRHQPQQKIPLKATKEEPLPEKSGHPTTSLPLSMPMASWPGGLPPVGYVAPPLQGVVSMDGSTMTPAPVQPLCSQPRPKRCATHCHIARNIYSLQQLMKMSHFWPAPAGPAPLFGSKPCNVNVTPPSDLQANVCVRGVNNAEDKGQSLASTPNNGGKEKGSQPASISDSAQRKQQFVIQQPVPPVAAPSNLLGPAFFFPFNQQQAAVAARPGAPRPSATGASSGSTSSSSGSSSSVAAGPAAAMSFNYPNIAANETQYLAILQNNAYPFPMPAVGAPPNYRGAPAQAMPLFSGPPFYSSQMIHPSELQHPQPPPSTQTQQLLQNQQNASASSGSSLSQKHLHGQQQRPQSSVVAVGSGSANMQNFASPKNQQSQQLQQSHNQYVHSSRPKQLEGEVGSEDSPTADSRGARASVNVYGTSFAMPIHPQNYDLLTPAALAGAPATSGSSNQTEKQVHQLQQQGSKSGVESLTQQSFAMSFGPINGTTTGPGIDISSMAQNHAMLNNSPEGTRQNVQMMAAAAAQVAQKNFRISEDGKSGSVDSSATDDERKSFSGKALGGVGQSITFTRSDLAEGPAVSMPPNTVASGPSRSSRSRTNNAAVGTINVSTAHIQAQIQQHHMMQLKQQQLGASPVSRSKAPATSNGSLYPEHLNSSSAMAAKFPNTLSGFPQSLVQSNSSSPVQSPQWKSSNRTPTSPAPSSLGSSKGTMLKNIPQQHSRSQPQMHTQISFGGNQKPSVSQGQANPSSNQSSSSILVGSPTTSSISKGASGSPRTTTHATTTTSKMGQAPMLSSQQSKNLPSITGHKSPSILGNTHISSSSSSNVAKAQVQQQPQQQLPKTMQQAHLFFSTPYTHSQSLHSAGISSTTSSPGGHYLQRRRPDQQPQAPVALATPSTGVLSLCPPVTLAGTSTNDPAKAIAAATSNIKGGGRSSQGIIQTSQFAGQSVGTILPAGFPYVHSVPAAVQVKTADQKQPAGHDNLHTWQFEKK